jgi:hypothetical protein
MIVLDLLQVPGILPKEFPGVETCEKRVVNTPICFENLHRSRKEIVEVRVANEPEITGCIHL